MVAIEITGSSLLKPSSPHHLLYQHVPLSIFDRGTMQAHVPIIFVYLPPTPQDSAMKEALRKALFYFPHLAGRLSTDNLRRPTILLNDAGARVIETRINSPLQDALPVRPTRELEKLHPGTEEADELLQVQLNRFACGGLVVGLTWQHRAADGQAMNTFFSAWARLVKGLELDRLPYHDRAAVAIPRNPRKIEFNHHEVEFGEIPNSMETGVAAEDNTNVVIRFSAEFISKLREKLQPGNPNRRCSTFQCLLTHVWKKLTMVRKLPPEVTTMVRIAVNGRPRMEPKVPTEYFGNLVLWAYPEMTAEELLSRSYGEVADAIHAAVSKVDDRYFKSFIDFGESAAWEMTTIEEEKSLTPHMEVDSWLSFDYHKLDFGGGGPVQVLTYFPLEGMGVFVQAPDETGAVDFQIVLLPHQIDPFKEIAHVLDS